MRGVLENIEYRIQNTEYKKKGGEKCQNLGQKIGPGNGLDPREWEITEYKNCVRILDL